MADVIALPTAAAQPVINPKRRGGTPPRNVTRRAQLGTLRRRRQRHQQELRAQITQKPALHDQVAAVAAELMSGAKRGDFVGLGFVLLQRDGVARSGVVGAYCECGDGRERLGRELTRFQSKLLDWIERGEDDQ